MKRYRGRFLYKQQVVLQVETKRGDKRKDWKRSQKDISNKLSSTNFSKSEVDFA